MCIDRLIYTQEKSSEYIIETYYIYIYFSCSYLCSVKQFGSALEKQQPWYPQVISLFKHVVWIITQLFKYPPFVLNWWKYKLPVTA